MTPVPVPVAGIQLWCFDLDQIENDTALSVEERQRAARFAFARDRFRYVRAHVVLRRLLARFLGCTAPEVPLVSDANGRPTVALTGGPDFNLSHGGAWGAVALASPGLRVGVDVEPLRRVADADNTAQAVFTEVELAAWRARPGGRQDHDFLRLWTRKEAVLKALGLGLALAPQRLAVGLEPGVVTVSPPDGLPPVKVSSIDAAGPALALSLAWFSPAESCALPR